MEYEIEVSNAAERQLNRFAARDRRVIVDAIEQRLTHEPNVASRHRKLLRENPLAKWEPRVGQFRVFYDIEEGRVLVLIVAVGFKDHNVLKIDGEAFPL